MVDTADMDGQYRYSLTRELPSLGLAPNRGTVLFIMLNPSTATADTNDQTVRRCIAFARLWDFSRLVVCNLYALRSTDPAALKTHPSPTGERNAEVIVAQARAATKVVAAWGTLPDPVWADVIANMVVRYHNIYALKVTKDGHPQHPLYVRGDVTPVVWRPHA